MYFVCGNIKLSVFHVLVHVCIYVFILISHNTCIVYFKLKIISSENAHIIVMKMFFNKNDYNSFYDFMGKILYFCFKDIKYFYIRIFIKVTPETF